MLAMLKKLWNEWGLEWVDVTPAATKIQRQADIPESGNKETTTPDQDMQEDLPLPPAKSAEETTVQEVVTADEPSTSNTWQVVPKRKTQVTNKISAKGKEINKPSLKQRASYGSSIKKALRSQGLPQDIRRETSEPAPQNSPASNLPEQPDPTSQNINPPAETAPEGAET